MGTIDFVEAFERAARALPLEASFADVEIVEHRARKVGRAVELSLTIDRPGGVDLATCEKIAARLGAALEGELQPYTLEVESAGVERALRLPADYERFAGSPVTVTTSLAIEHEYTHSGTLRGLRGNALVLEGKAGELPIPLELVKSATLQYDYRADLRRAKRERRERR